MWKNSIATASIFFLGSYALASGTPVANCVTKDGLQVSFNLERTDEELYSVLDADHQDDQFSTLSEDTTKDGKGNVYASMSVSRVAANPKAASKTVAQIALPAFTQGFVSETEMVKGEKGKPGKYLNVFVVNAAGAKGSGLLIQIVASNKTNLDGDMTGLMTFTAMKDGKKVADTSYSQAIEEDFSLKTVAVTCQTGWE